MLFFLVKGALINFLENGKMTKGGLIEISSVEYYKHRNSKALFGKGEIKKSRKGSEQ